MNYFVFGDSHCNCFSRTFPNKVYVYPASSAKGLSNPMSKTAVNKRMTDIISLLPENSNIILFFGKVDLDFIINYKYNTTQNINLNEYVLAIANSYIEFVKLNITNHKVFICEIPITHIDDISMLSIINIQEHMHNINSHLLEKYSSVYNNFSKIIPYNERVSLYELFNNELKNKCKTNNFTFLEINKYFRKTDGKFEIPIKYINKLNKLDHHLSNDIVELYLKSLKNN